MLSELIRDKIQEIFLVYQNENNIISGDIEPLDALRLEQIEESLCELIEKVVKYQQRGHSASYEYCTAEGESYVKTYELIDMDEFFCEVSNIIAFGDCTNYTLTSICFDGKEIEYAGWQPGMRFEYEDMDCNTVWFGSFPEWDH